MDTIEVCEHLLYKNPSLRELFYCLNIINEDVSVQCINHPEFENILSDFSKNIKIINVFSLIHYIMIIEPKEFSRRRLPVLIIQGNACEKVYLSRSFIISQIVSILNVKDFLPSGLSRKIVYIQDYETMEGVIFSEYLKNKWTIDDPLKMKVSNLVKTTPREIVSNIVNDF